MKKIFVLGIIALSLITVSLTAFASTIQLPQPDKKHATIQVEMLSTVLVQVRMERFRQELPRQINGLLIILTVLLPTNSLDLCGQRMRISLVVPEPGIRHWIT